MRFLRLHKNEGLIMSTTEKAASKMPGIKRPGISIFLEYPAGISTGPVESEVVPQKGDSVLISGVSLVVAERCFRIDRGRILDVTLKMKDDV
jgi:hypothetical protein